MQHAVYRVSMQVGQHVVKTPAGHQQLAGHRFSDPSWATAAIIRCLGGFFGSYFYFHLSNFLAGYFYFYLSAEGGYF